MKAKTPVLLQKLNAAVQTLDGKKADQITVLDLAEKSTVARYFIIASATSHTHLSALRKSLTELWQERFGSRLNCEAHKESGWQVVDADEIMIHLFTPEERTRYNLEALWGDAKEVSVKLRAIA
jgi:ribosome-associated protein